jgi:hypothetical protein
LLADAEPKELRSLNLSKSWSYNFKLNKFEHGISALSLSTSSSSQAITEHGGFLSPAVRGPTYYQLAHSQMRVRILPVRTFCHFLCVIGAVTALSALSVDFSISGETAVCVMIPIPIISFTLKIDHSIFSA